MRVVVFVALLTVTFASSAQLQDATTGHNDVEDAVRRFFSHVAAFDYSAMRSALTMDFELIEAGRRMNASEFEAFLRTMEESGRRFSFEISEFNTEIVGDVAYTSYRSRNSQGDGEWLETVILRRVDGRWLMDRGQSLPLRRAGP